MQELEDELRVKPVDDLRKVEIWRTHVLIQAGYPRLVAERMAERHDIDLHVAVDIVASAGCPPYIAERILS